MRFKKILTQILELHSITKDFSVRSICNELQFQNSRDKQMLVHSLVTDLFESQNHAGKSHPRLTVARPSI